mmetsp:Transcript_3951/g.14937  ORF Transcript_3951/g.14937 Transcript_3951/m.14937 type:complete len:1073 (-) Transcript_3951:55-3273(-)|eukprot:CAMPEP_0117438468 /NCGR_PEP_ID=MMETSP0759-20121206/2069_1 /TAXON_ID=63605 /ORGANISM="Percolomonas cosmopolitus, Strain WS" /LENGTH=1072 /DNA_ID=CAMNT_0005230161 /DNA_START=66 /DNA_END=3284 /DNA_ORIENTATION=+
MVLDMRGLQSFISDLRKAGGNQEKVHKRISKELAKIRKAFQKSQKLKGYDRKKYICKLLYVYMMGYEIDFGHIEAVNLLSSEKYSEKHVGYLACTLLLNEGHEMVTLITHSMKRDLNSKNPFSQALALTAIANIGGQEQAEALSQDVQKLLVSSHTQPDVRKKAALTLLKLYRKYPEIMPPEEWNSRVLNLLAGMNLGVITSVMSLVLALSADHPAEYKEAVPKAIHLISKLILQQNEYHKKYMYYGIRAPWLQIKLFRLLQYFPSPEDPSKIKNIMDAIERLITIAKRFLQGSSDRKSSVSRINALHSVLFEALNLAIHYDQDSRLLVEAANLLGRFLDDRDTNLRYLALDTMSRLAFTEHDTVVDAIRRKQNTILLALKDPDISIRRRALDLLYSMCNTNNAGQIVGELLDYCALADYAIREELVLKIAILAEKYATDLEWYVDVMLTLISQSGDFASPEIWYRIVQIVTNAENDELSKYAASTVFNTVSEPSAHERCIQVSAYLLGEFGYLIAEEPKSQPMEQFRVLLTKFQVANLTTKCILMNSFMKFYNLYEDDALRMKIRNLFKRLSDHVDPEIQQRAVEYHQLAQVSDHTMQVCLEQMPPFPERVGEASILIEMIKKREAVSAEKGVRRKKHHETVENNNVRVLKGSVGGLKELKHPTEEDEDQQQNGTPNMIDMEQQEGTGGDMNQDIDLLDDLLGLGPSTVTTNNTAIESNMYPQDNNYYGNQTQSPPQQPQSMGGGLELDDIFGDTSNVPQQPQHDVYNQGASPFDEDPYGGGYNMAEESARVAQQRQQQMESSGFTTEDLISQNKQTGPQVDEEAQKQAEIFHKKLTIQNKGVAIEVEKLQVALESEFHGFEGRVKLMYGNKTSTTIEKVRFEYEPISEVDVSFSQNSPLITGDAQISQYVKIACKKPFARSIHMSLYFECQRQDYRLNIRLPVHLHKFVTPQHFDQADEFFAEWNKISKGASGEQQEVFKAPGDINLKRADKILQGHGLSVMKHIDPKSHNFVSAGVFHSRDAGDTLATVRLECNMQKQAYRLTVRSDNSIVSEEIAKSLKDHLSTEEEE